MCYESIIICENFIIVDVKCHNSLLVRVLRFNLHFDLLGTIGYYLVIYLDTIFVVGFLQRLISCSSQLFAVTDSTTTIDYLLMLYVINVIV